MTVGSINLKKTNYDVINEQGQIDPIKTQMNGIKINPQPEADTVSFGAEEKQEKKSILPWVLGLGAVGVLGLIFHKNIKNFWNKAEPVVEKAANTADEVAKSGDGAVETGAKVAEEAANKSEGLVPDNLKVLALPAPDGTAGDAVKTNLSLRVRMLRAQVRKLVERKTNMSNELANIPNQLSKIDTKRAKTLKDVNEIKESLIKINENKTALSAEKVKKLVAEKAQEARILLEKLEKLNKEKTDTLISKSQLEQGIQEIDLKIQSKLDKTTSTFNKDELKKARNTGIINKKQAEVAQKEQQALTEEIERLIKSLGQVNS